MATDDPKNTAARNSLYLLLLAGELVLVLFMVIVTVLLYVSGMINGAQLIFRVSSLILIPPVAGVIGYFLGGHSFMRAFNYSAAVLLVIMATFIANTARTRHHRAVETAPPANQQKEEYKPKKGDITADAGDGGAALQCGICLYGDVMEWS